MISEAPQRQTPEDRARYLLDTLLPKMTSRDQAMDNLFYITPDATPELRLWSIAAALYILNDTKCACGRYVIPDGQNSVAGPGFDSHNRSQCFVRDTPSTSARRT